MNKTLRLATVAVLALVSSFTVAQTVTFSAPDPKGSNTSAMGTDQMSKDGITIVTSSGGFDCENYATKAKEYRFGKSSENTFTSTAGNITKVVFTCTKSGDEKYGPGCFANPSVGTYTFEGDKGTWTGDAASFTLTALTNQVRATKIEITLNGTETPPVVEDVKAANIAAFNALADGTEAKLTLNDAQVLYSWTSNGGNTQTFVRDATGTVMFYNTGLDLKAGQKLNGSVVLKRADFNGTIEAVKAAGTNAEGYTVAEGTAEPKVIEVTEATQNLSNLVQLNNVNIISEVSGKYTNFYVVSGANKIQLFNGFYLDGYTPAVAEGVDVVGIITLFKGNYQIQPITAPVTTGIGAVQLDENGNAPVYNVSGQRVGAAYKGLVIKNGKKYIRK